MAESKAHKKLNGLWSLVALKLVILSFPPESNCWLCGVVLKRKEIAAVSGGGRGASLSQQQPILIWRRDSPVVVFPPSLTDHALETELSSLCVEFSGRKSCAELIVNLFHCV